MFQHCRFRWEKLVDPKRVFIISTSRMFSNGLEILLRSESQIEVVGQDADIERAIRRLNKLQPDVVIIDSAASLFELRSALICILIKHSIPKVIRLSLSNNSLDIYEASHCVSAGVTELITAIQSE